MADRTLSQPDNYLAGGLTHTADHEHASILGDAMGWTEKNVLNPVANAAVLEPYNAVASTVNAVTGHADHPLLKEAKLYDVPNADFLSAQWLSQNISSGLGMLVPYVVAGKVTGAGMKFASEQVEAKGLTATFLNSDRSAQILGAGLYDGMRSPRDGETRIGNALAGMAGFGVFEYGNALSLGLSPVNRVVARIGVGALGGATSQTVSHLVSQGELPSFKDYAEAGVSGGVMNLLLPVAQRGLGHVAERVGILAGGGVPAEHYIHSKFGGDDVLSRSSMLASVVGEGAKIKEGAKIDFENSSRNKLELAGDIQRTPEQLAAMLKRLNAARENNYEAEYKAAQAQLNGGNVEKAWQTFRKIRLNQEVDQFDARLVEHRVARELGRLEGKGASGGLKSAIEELIAKSQAPSDIAWQQEFEQFKESGGKYRPEVSFKGSSADAANETARPAAKSEVSDPAAKPEVSDQVAKPEVSDQVAKPEVTDQTGKQADALEARALATHLVKALQAKGYTTVFAGGAVRDEIRGYIPKDYDIATSATPDQVERVFKNSGATVFDKGKSFGVMAVAIDGHVFEIATLRTDGEYKDGRRPDSVQFVTSLMDDAARRDLTVNAMFRDPVSGALHDYFGGQEDMARGILRAVGDPVARINEDPLRMFRAVRFVGKLGFELDADFMKAIQDNAEKIHTTSKERWRDELEGVLTSKEPVRALNAMRESGLMRQVLPEVEEMFGPRGAQDPFWHSEGNAGVHTFEVVGNLAKSSGGDWVTMLAGLLHDNAKPDTQVIHDDGHISNHGHDSLGAEKAKSIAERLKMSKADTAKLVALIQDHMKMHTVKEMRPATLSKLMEQPYFVEKMQLQNADAHATHAQDGRSLSHFDFLQQELSRMQSAAEPSAQLNAKPLVNGDILKQMQFKPGPLFKLILESTRDAQREGKIVTEEDGRKFVDENFDQYRGLTLSQQTEIWKKDKSE
jgi:poly(A) polymerase